MRRALWLACLLAIGCGETAEDWRRYPVTGTVAQLQPGDPPVAVVDHDEIEGWMGAMKMGFPVPDVDEFAKLSEGDSIEAVVMVRGELEYYLTEIRIAELR